MTATQFTRTTGAFILRDVATGYGRQAGGYLWAVVEPVAGIVLLTLLFSMAFIAPPLGDDFATFYATGLLPFTVYLHLHARTMLTLRVARPLLHYPAVSFMHALIGRAILAIITQSVVFLLVLTGVIMLFEPRISIHMPTIGLAVLMLVALGLGVGVLNCLLIGMFPVWQRVWSVLNRPLFLLSGVFYLFESVAEPWRSILWYNPLIHVVGILRAGLYPFYPASYAAPTYVFFVALGCAVTGLLFLRRYHKEILTR